MTSDEQNALRLLLREEVNAAIYASEQRMGERYGQLDERMDQLTGQIKQLDGRMDRLDDRIGRLNEHVDRLEAGQRELQTNIVEIKHTLTKVILMLHDVTKVSNELQASQRAMEVKIEQNLLGLRRDMQRLSDTVHSFANHFIDTNRATNDRISVHEKTPVEETHPNPHSAA